MHDLDDGKILFCTWVKIICKVDLSLTNTQIYTTRKRLQKNKLEQVEVRCVSGEKYEGAARGGSDFPQPGDSRGHEDLP